MRSNVDLQPRSGKLPLFSLRPNERYLPGVGTLKRIIHWLGKRQHFASCYNQGIRSHMRRLGLPRLCSHADADAPINALYVLLISTVKFVA